MERITIRTMALPHQAVAAGDIRAMCLKDVYGYVARRVPRIEDAEDVTAEVFAVALANMPRDVREPRACKDAHAQNSVYHARSIRQARVSMFKR